MKGISPEALSIAIGAVHEGTAWLDPAVARMVLSRFSGESPAAPGQTPVVPMSGAALNPDCPSPRVRWKSSS